jgi:hypothetical protein
VKHRLQPLGNALAGRDTHDPYRGLAGPGEGPSVAFVTADGFAPPTRTRRRVLGGNPSVPSMPIAVPKSDAHPDEAVLVLHQS